MITCKLYPEEEFIEIYDTEDGRLRGWVRQYPNSDEVYLTSCSTAQNDGISQFTFNELHIIMDNWNQMMELKNANKQ